jgi:hypothetical protein
MIRQPFHVAKPDMAEQPCQDLCIESGRMEISGVRLPSVPAIKGGQREDTKKGKKGGGVYCLMLLE